MVFYILVSFCIFMLGMIVYSGVDFVGKFVIVVMMWIGVWFVINGDFSVG